jgi:hypothetical protein
MSGLSPGQIALIPWLARLGILRLVPVLPPDPELPARQQAEYRALFAATKNWEYILATEKSFVTTNEQARRAGPVGHLLLMVIMGGDSEASGVGLALQHELQALSTNSGQHVIADATHNSLVHNQQHAQQTSRAIVAVVEAVRRGTLLQP